MKSLKSKIKVYVNIFNKQILIQNICFTLENKFLEN